jgi:opacity protein-like surface antigen
MARSTTLIALGAMIAAAAPPPPPRPRPAAPPVMEEGPGLSELGTGWYLRGDLGYVRFDEPKDLRLRELRSFLGKEEAEEAFLRRFRHRLQVPQRLPRRRDRGPPLRHRLRRERLAHPVRHQARAGRGRLESTTILANGYSTSAPGTGSRLTSAAASASPRTATTAITGPGPRRRPNRQAALFIPGRTLHNFAWALTAGAAVEVGHGFSVDVGYRYANLGPSHSDIARLGLVTKGEDIQPTRPGRPALHDRLKRRVSPPGSSPSPSRESLPRTRSGGRVGFARSAIGPR